VSQAEADPHVAALCPQCALCCDGTLFADVALLSAAEADQLRGLALPLKTVRGKPRLPQPCAALEGCRCRIYPERPTRCRAFECALLLKARAGEVSLGAALREIRRTRGLAETARRLLRELGDDAEAQPLKSRFQRVARRLESGCEPSAAERFARLSRCVHDLHLRLASRFYPG
jgi:hypothetical protein